ncbi:hypothetical protein GW17_00053703 [Ensete ventricosum]|nr:hypothetical protein GW17_00053703 [Ensete ventricosum]
MAVEGAKGFGTAGWGATLVLRTSWFNRSSPILAKKIAAIRVYDCRTFTSPRISDFTSSIKVHKSYFSDQSTVWLDKHSNLVWYSCIVEVYRIFANCLSMLSKSVRPKRFSSPSLNRCQERPPWVRRLRKSVREKREEEEEEKKPLIPLGFRSRLRNQRIVRNKRRQIEPTRRSERGRGDVIVGVGGTNGSSSVGASDTGNVSRGRGTFNRIERPHINLQPNNGPRSSLGIRPSLDDALGPRREFAERTGKLVGSTPEDH